LWTDMRAVMVIWKSEKSARSAETIVAGGEERTPGTGPKRMHRVAVLQDVRTAQMRRYAARPLFAGSVGSSFLVTPGYCCIGATRLYTAARPPRRRDGLSACGIASLVIRLGGP
jgi:hypothetical protein